MRIIKKWLQRWKTRRLIRKIENELLPATNKIKWWHRIFFIFCKKRIKLHAMIVPGWYVKVTYKVFLGKWFVLKTEKVTLPPMHPNCKCYLGREQYIRGHHADHIILDDWEDENN